MSVGYVHIVTVARKPVSRIPTDAESAIPGMRDIGLCKDIPGTISDQYNRGLSVGAYTIAKFTGACQGRSLNFSLSDVNQFCGVPWSTSLQSKMRLWHVTPTNPKTLRLDGTMTGTWIHRGEPICDSNCGIRSVSKWS